MSRRRILLMQPSVGHMDTMRSAPALPLGLLHAASMVAESFEVEIFDQRLHRDWRAALVGRLGPDLLLVGTTSYTGTTIGAALDMCKVVRAKTPEVPIVLGGIHASLLPHQSVRSPQVDFVVEGEGERPLLALAEALAAGAQPEAPGLWTKRNGEVCGQPRAGFAELASMPEPPLHLVDVQKYLPRYLGRKSLYFQSSRGCPMECSYCYNVVFNDRKWRALPAKLVLERVARLVAEHGAEDLYFVDDTFFINLDRGREIARGLCDLDVTWQVQGVDIPSLKRMTDADFDLILRSGCSRLSVGVESGSPKIRRTIHKQGTIDDIREITSRLAAWPITLYYSFICGLPTETIGDLRATVDLMFDVLERNPRVRVSPLYNFSPFPGTEAFDAAVNAGLRVPDTLEGWSAWDYATTQLYPERRQLYERLYFTSLFMDDKTKEYAADSPLMRRLSQAYRPIARLRTKHLFVRGMVLHRAMDPAIRLLKAPVLSAILGGASGS